MWQVVSGFWDKLRRKSRQVAGDAISAAPVAMGTAPVVMEVASSEKDPEKDSEKDSEKAPRHGQVRDEGKRRKRRGNRLSLGTTSGRRMQLQYATTATTKAAPTKAAPVKASDKKHRDGFGVWTKQGCRYCVRTTQLLAKHGAPYNVHSGGLQAYMNSDEFKALLRDWNETNQKATPFRSVYPVVVRYDSEGKVTLVGGYDEVAELMR